MAQPAVPVNEDRTDLLGIPPFWARTSVNPPFIWETWVGQFFLAVSLKDNISPGELLVAPAELVDEPYPKHRVLMKMPQSWPIGTSELQQLIEESMSTTKRGEEKDLALEITGVTMRQRRG